jgi:hypothetical protein
MVSILANPLHADTFDAAAWLTAWTEGGGIYFLAGGSIHLCQARPLDPAATANLSRLKSRMHRAGGGPAIAELLIRRRNGDVM